MSTEATFEDAFNLLCGDKLGEGISRTVYECRLRPELVVKVESGVDRRFANVFEHAFWQDYRHQPKVAQWLAPCERISPDGRILLQRRADPLARGYELPEKLPTFLTDHKESNFGLIDGRLVCLDYAITVLNPSIVLKKAYFHT